MSENGINDVLSEIADLLRQFVAQSADAQKRAADRLSRIPDARTLASDFAALQAKSETEETERREEAAQRRAEDVAFRERLVGAVEEQNALIRTLLNRVASAAPTILDQSTGET